MENYAAQVDKLRHALEPAFKVWQENLQSLEVELRKLPDFTEQLERLSDGLTKQVEAATKWAEQFTNIKFPKSD